MSTFPGFGTNAVHVGQEPEQWEMNQVSGGDESFPCFENKQKTHCFRLTPVEGWVKLISLDLPFHSSEHRTLRQLLPIDSQSVSGCTSHLSLHYLQAGCTWTAQGKEKRRWTEIKDQFEAHDYSRAGNPTRDVLQANLAALEDAKYCKFSVLHKTIGDLWELTLWFLLLFTISCAQLKLRNNDGL